MARRSGMMTALQAALAGFSGGIEGRMQQRAADEEKSRVAAALARQQGQDARAMEDRTMAMEDREQAKQDRLQSQRVAFLKAGYVPDGLDMPGATPRTPVSSEMVGGQRFSMYETPQQMSRRVAIEEATFKAKMKPADTLTLWQKEQIKQKELDRGARKSGSEKAEPSDEQKRKLGNQYMASQARNPALIAALQNTFSNDPEAAADPGLVAYDLMKSKIIPRLGAGKGFEPPKPKDAATGGNDLADLKAQIEQRKAGKSSPSVKPQAPASPVVSRPTASPKPLDPSVDQEKYKSDAGYRLYVDSLSR